MKIYQCICSAKRPSNWLKYITEYHSTYNDLWRSFSCDNYSNNEYSLMESLSNENVGGLTGSSKVFSLLLLNTPTV